MADAGSLLCLHDSYRSTCEGLPELVNLLSVAEPQTTANPQVRLGQEIWPYTWVVAPGGWINIMHWE